MKGTILSGNPSRILDLTLASDNKSQPTAIDCMDVIAVMEIDPAVTHSETSNGNAETERLMRTMKEPWLCLREAIGRWVAAEHPLRYIYSRLGAKSPLASHAAYR